MNVRFLKTALITAAAVTAGVVLGLAAPAGAAPMTFTGGWQNHTAQATFDLRGDGLYLTLANISDIDATSTNDVLNSVFFDITGRPTLAVRSATLAGGSTVQYGGTQPVGGNVGGEWAYRQGVDGAPLGAYYGASSAGLGLFGPHHLIGGADLDGVAGPSGSYGLLPLGDDLTTGVGGPLIKSGVTFRFDVPTDDTFSLANINNVSFQYGTALTASSWIPATFVNLVPQSDPAPGFIPGGGTVLASLVPPPPGGGVPEPATMFLSAAAVMLGLTHRPKRVAAAAG